MDLAPIYSTINADPETILTAHHGQVTVVHKGRPSAHKATLEIFELGQQVDLAAVVQLAQHLGLAPRDNRALLQALDEELNELEAEDAGLLEDRSRLRTWLDQAVLRLGAAEQDLDTVLLQLEQATQRGNRLAESLRFADEDRAELRRQIAALRRALDAAAEAGTVPTAPAAATPAVKSQAVRGTAAPRDTPEHTALELDGTECSCGFISFSSSSLRTHITRANRKAGGESLDPDDSPGGLAPGRPLPMKGRVTDLHAKDAADLHHEPTAPGSDTCSCGFRASTVPALSIHLVRANGLVRDEAA